MRASSRLPTVDPFPVRNLPKQCHGHSGHWGLGLGDMTKKSSIITFGLLSTPFLLPLPAFLGGGGKGEGDLIRMMIFLLLLLLLLILVLQYS